MSTGEAYTADYEMTVEVTSLPDETLSEESTFYWHIITYRIIGTFGMVDNGLAIVVIVFSKHMRRKVCNLLIINQSVVDFLASLLLVINSPLVANGTAPDGVLGHLYCRLWANSYPLWSAFLISTGNLVMITIERFMEVVHPFKHKVYFTRRRAYVAIALIWIVYTVLEFVLAGYSSRPEGTSCVIYVNYPSEAVRIVDSILLYMLTIVIPVTVMLYCYVRMIRTTKRVAPQMSTLSAAEKARFLRQERIKRNLIKALVTVCVAYILCVGWNQTYFFLINLNVKLPFGTPFYYFTVYALFLNCLINPIIYTANYREFQNAAKDLLHRLHPNTAPVAATSTDQATLNQSNIQA